MSRRSFFKGSVASVAGVGIAAGSITGITSLSGCSNTESKNKHRYKKLPNNSSTSKKDNSKSLLIKGGKLLNVFTGLLESKNILIKNKIIVAIGDYNKADEIIDAAGKIIIPSFIDAHMHIESTHLTPPELAKIVVPHGTGVIVTDPHEIANVCGADGINYMLQASVGIPMDVFFTMPSCVPATKFDESGAALSADDLYPFYEYDNVVGLSEVMDYPSVIAGEESVMQKISDAKNCHEVICGHAPGLNGDDLQKYIAAGIEDEHECTTFEEALEKLNNGQSIIIREGSSAHNLQSLSGLFDDKYFRNCMFCADDKTAGDIIREGHIDYIIKQAINYGCKPVNAILMATIQAARHYNIQGIGAVSPGYYANLNIVDSLELLNIDKVLHKGEIVFNGNNVVDFDKPQIEDKIQKSVLNTFKVKTFNAEDFKIEQPSGKKIRAIQLVPNEILTKETIIDSPNGDTVKLAVCERHKNTGHIGLGYVVGSGMKEGALASSTSHDSHNLITIGKNDEDMALAANTIKEMGGGACVVKNSKVLFKQEHPIAGLICDEPGVEAAKTNTQLYDTAKTLGFSDGINPFMTTSFCSLTVIPELRLTTLGLVDVNKQELVDLFV